MILLPDEAKLFFYLMYRLQFYVNLKTQIFEDVTTLEGYLALDRDAKLQVRNRLWGNVSLIDQYIKHNPDQLSKAHLQIIHGWKQVIVGDFFIERIGKRQAIFIQEQDVYGVIGLTDELGDVIPRQALPLRVMAALLPFKGQIVYDGLLQTYSVIFGRGIKTELKEVYMAAKQNRRLITSLDDDPGAPVDPVTLPDYGPTLAEMAKLARKLHSTKDAPAVWTPSFKLLRSTLELVEAATAAPDDLDRLWNHRNTLVKQIKSLDTILERAERG
jgi:hypothetical protein